MISNDRIQAVMELAQESDKVKLRFLAKAVAQTLNAFKTKYSTANLRNWKAAESELEDYLSQIESDQESDAGPAPSVLSFDNLQKVLIYLKGQSWKVSQSTLYKHNKAGLLKPEKTGQYLLASVESYAANYLKRLDGSVVSDDDDTKKKREAEIRKVVAQAEHWELKTKTESGLYVPKDLYEKNMAARAKVLKSDLLGFCRSEAPDIVNKVEGNPELIPDLIQFMTERVLNCLNRYCEENVVNG